MTRLNTTTPLPGSARSGQRAPQLVQMVRSALPIPSAPGLAVSNPTAPPPVSAEAGMYEQMGQLFQAAGVAGREVASMIRDIREDERRLIRGKLTMEAQMRSAEVFDAIRRGEIALPEDDADVSEWAKGMFAEEVSDLDDEMTQLYLATAAPSLTNAVLQHRESVRGRELANLATEIGDIIASTTPGRSEIEAYQRDLMDRGLSEAEAIEATIMPGLQTAASMGNRELFAYYEEQLGGRFKTQLETLRNQMEVQLRNGYAESLEQVQSQAWSQLIDQGRPVETVKQWVQESSQINADDRARLIKSLESWDLEEQGRTLSQRKRVWQTGIMQDRVAQAYEFMRAGQLSQVQGFTAVYDEDGSTFEVNATELRKLATEQFYAEYPLLPPNEPVTDQNLPLLIRNVQERLKWAAENQMPDPQMRDVLSTGIATLESPDFANSPDASLAAQYGIAVFDAAYAQNPVKAMEIAGDSYAAYRTLDVVARWKHGGDVQKAAAEMRTEGVMRRDIFRASVSHEKLAAFMMPKLEDRPWSFRSMTNGTEMMGDIRELTTFYMAQGLPQERAMETAWEDFSNRFVAIRGVWLPRDSRWNAEAADALELYAKNQAELLGMDHKDIGFRTDPANPDVLMVVNQRGELLTPPGQSTGVMTVTIGQLRANAAAMREEIAEQAKERIAREQLTRLAKRVITFSPGGDVFLPGGVIIPRTSPTAIAAMDSLDRMVDYRMEHGEWPKEFQTLLRKFEEYEDAEPERRRAEEQRPGNRVGSFSGGVRQPDQEMPRSLKAVADAATAFWEWLTRERDTGDRVIGLGMNR